VRDSNLDAYWDVACVGLTDELLDPRDSSRGIVDHTTEDLPPAPLGSSPMVPR